MRGGADTEVTGQVSLRLSAPGTAGRSPTILRDASSNLEFGQAPRKPSPPLPPGACLQSPWIVTVAARRAA